MLCQPYFAFSSYSKEISIVIYIQGVAKRFAQGFPFHECGPVFLLMPWITSFLTCAEINYVICLHLLISEIRANNLPRFKLTQDPALVPNFLCLFRSSR